ncbi:MAG: type II/IV secretion system protein [Ignavibacteriales bacterium]|nr:type II/IV secretion system protein [Ignavibacteriales bacterium]
MSQARIAKKELGDLLVEKGIITAHDLLGAIDILSKEDSKNRRKLPQVLVDELHLDRDKIYGEIANYYAFRTIDLAKEVPTDDNVNFMRQELNNLPVAIKTLALENHVLPFMVDRDRPDRLLVITPDPTKREVYTIARAFSFPKFEICYVRLGQWQELWQRVNIGRSAYADFESDTGKEGVLGEMEEDSDLYEQALEEEINRSGLVELVERIFMDAVRAGASDIHVMPRGEKKTEFHFRVDGRLSLWYTHAETRAEAVSAVVKDRAMNLDRFERNTAQDGFAQFIVDRKTVRFRVSVIPIVGKELKSKFESIVIRVLQEPSFSTRIQDLGFDSYSENSFRKAIEKPYGMIVVTGPTGSGKSTTLFSALKTVMDPSLNVITVEDPVEYFIDGARQVKLNPKLDFDGALRAILRHDPDIVMVGEIRDRITAELAIKLANTGHLTFATLHTNDAVSAIARLYKMGVEPFLIAYTLNIVLAQRLIRKLCDRCKTPATDIEKEALVKLGVSKNDLDKAKISRPVGCANCVKGFRGRLPIHEALYFNKAIRRHVLQADTNIDEEILRNQALKDGMQTLRQSGLNLVLRGITTLEEVAAVTVEDD